MTISLIATSHGTEAAAARATITALVEAVREASPHLDVREAFVDVQSPGVEQVVREVEGLAVVLPLLLSPGFHVRVDVRRAADRPSVVAADALGPDRRLTDILLRRLREAGATRDDAVVLGAAGSTDPLARLSIAAAAGMLQAAVAAPVRVGHLGGPGVSVEEAVRGAARSGRRVVVASYLMAPGVFHERLLGCGADVVTSPLLDGRQVPPPMVSLVLDRFAAAATSLDRSAVAGATHHPRPWSSSGDRR